MKDRKITVWVVEPSERSGLMATLKQLDVEVPAWSSIVSECVASNEPTRIKEIGFVR